MVIYGGMYGDICGGRYGDLYIYMRRGMVIPVERRYGEICGEGGMVMWEREVW